MNSTVTIPVDPYILIAIWLIGTVALSVVSFIVVYIAAERRVVR